jgi:hypothetical protein
MIEVCEIEEFIKHSLADIGLLSTLIEDIKKNLFELIERIVFLGCYRGFGYFRFSLDEFIYINLKKLRDLAQL